MDGEHGGGDPREPTLHGAAPGARWFRDWFYPLWRDCGRAEIMNRFFRELARHFPR